MLKGVNDTEQCAKQLIKLMAQFPSKVNLIEFNSWPGVKFEPTERKDMKNFQNIYKIKVICLLFVEAGVMMFSLHVDN